MKKLMKKLTRHAIVMFAALILAVVVGAGTALPDSMAAQAQFGTTFHIHSETTGSTSTGPGGTTQTSSSTSEQTSDDGQTFTDNQSSQSNPDGSTNEHEKYEYTGKDWGGSYSRDENRDSKGNRKVHKEEKIRKNGKCTILITDEEYDKNNKLVKQEKKELACGEYNLEWSRDSTISAGGATTQYGPDKALITLARDGHTHVGSYVGQFHGTILGTCQGTMVLPTSVEVTAREDEFQDLDFTVKVTSNQTSFVSCPGAGSASATTSPVTYTRTFHLAARDGESQVLSIPAQGGQVTDKFTLRVRDD